MIASMRRSLRHQNWVSVDMTDIASQGLWVVAPCVTSAHSGQDGLSLVGSVPRLQLTFSWDPCQTPV